MKALANLILKQKRRLPPIILLAIFITVVLIIRVPIRQTFEYNPDEGINLMKSLLFLNGFSLYKQIANDQPPLFTLILSYWFKLLGPSVYHGRILILIFSCLLLWAFYQTIKSLWGSFPALIAVIFLLLSTGYLNLSISVMIGTPALSLAMLSVYFLTLYKRQRLKRFLVLSGIFMALSLQTKLFTIFLLPLMVLEIVQVRKQSQPALAVCLWLASLLVVFLSIAIPFFNFNLPMFIQQLSQPHLKRIEVVGCDFLIIWRMILRDWDTALLALSGIILLARKRKQELLFPVWCLVLVLAILVYHRPVWHHYYLAVAIFLSWLAAISFSEFFRHNIRNKSLRWITLAMIILAILRLPAKYNMLRESIWGETSPTERRVVELLSQYKEQAQWMVTDRPIFAFYTNILVPPELVLITHKRQFTDDSRQGYLIDKLDQHKPELILLNRIQYYGPQVISYIESNYTNVYQSAISIPTGEIYIDNTIMAEFQMMLARMWPANKKHPYKLSYRLLGKDDRYRAAQVLVETLEELIELYSQLSNPNTVSPLTIDAGKFRIKPYEEVPAEWQGRFPNQAMSFFAYQVFKKILRQWQKEQDPAYIHSTLSGLESLKHKAIKEIEKGLIINSFNPRGAIDFYKLPTANIKLYIHKDIINESSI